MDLDSILESQFSVKFFAKTRVKKFRSYLRSILFVPHNHETIIHLQIECSLKLDVVSKSNRNEIHDARALESYDQLNWLLPLSDTWQYNESNG